MPEHSSAKPGAPGGCKSLQWMNSRRTPWPQGSRNSVLEACDSPARHLQAAFDVSSCLQTLSLTQGQSLQRRGKSVEKANILRDTRREPAPRALGGKGQWAEGECAGTPGVTWEPKGPQEIKSFKMQIPKENRWVNPHYRSHGLDSGRPSRKTCSHLEAPPLPADPAAAGGWPQAEQTGYLGESSAPTQLPASPCHGHS